MTVEAKKITPSDIGAESTKAEKWQHAITIMVPSTSLIATSFGMSTSGAETLSPFKFLTNVEIKSASNDGTIMISDAVSDEEMEEILNDPETMDDLRAALVTKRRSKDAT